MAHNLPLDPKSLLAHTTAAQGEASDPLSSVWVSANAGAGKTHVLKRRVLRILLAGTKPDRILCLTYTKAAAAEMASRVFADLSQWATAAEPALARQLAEVLGREPSRDEQRDARKLFARAIETPGGLKVQTIHAFCERLLQRFPLEAGVPPGFTILDDSEGAKLRRRSVDSVLVEATRDWTSELGRALGTMITFAAGDGFDEVLRGALGKRDWLETTTGLLTGGLDLARFERAYRTALGVRHGATRDGIEREMASLMTVAELRHAVVALSSGGKSDADMASALSDAAAASDNRARVAALQRAFLTSALEPRADGRFVTKAVRQEHPDLHPRLARARDRFAGLMSERQGLIVTEASLALMRIAGEVMQRYTSGKAQRAALDFDDLVARTANLLEASSAAQWVLYKLDGGLDHVLVDEAQDTAPTQWRVIESLAREFFSGTGAREEARSVFAVGDEKQSIYSFQGAEPAMFAATGSRFRERVVAAGLPWRTVPLTLSFRTVAPLLAAVDRVFCDHARTPGLTAGGGAIEHVALRLGHAGFVEIWDTEKPEVTEEAGPWLPFEERPSSAPVTRLAARIASTIRTWIDTGEMLPSQGRPIRAGDVLILVRRRHPFAGPMVAALKARGVPVAGADRLRLTEQIAVQDLVALGHFLTLPEDDLSLATVLKSPLFGLDDSHLMAIAPARKGTLWSALIEAARQDGQFRPAAETLRRWRGLADQAPPFEFYSEVLDRDGGRRKLIERLGAEAIDPITEFIDLALQFDEAEPPSLTGFLEWIMDGAREVKRDMEHGRDEVRVLTVHGSKGLEAPIVFLPDTCSARAVNRPGELVEIAGAGLAQPVPQAVVWPVKWASRLEAIKAGRDAAAAREAEERNRLLYVAMTRARDRLYVAGFEGIRGRDRKCWYDLIVEGLGSSLAEIQLADGTKVQRLASQQEVAAEVGKDLSLAAVEPMEPPAWARTQAPHEPRLAIPFAPSKLAPYDLDEMGEPATPQSSAAKPLAIEARREPETPSPLRLADDNRFQRGLITHALLEHLPTLPAETWERAARGFVETRGRMLTPRVRASIASETLALLRDPRFAAVFGPSSRAEVPVVAVLPRPDGSGPPLRLNGQIDRLAVDGQSVLIVDYKTNRPPPADVDGVAPAYLFQLAAYTLALARIYPRRQVRAAILWTDGPRLMEIPANRLRDHAERLWRSTRGDLDA